MCKTTFTTNYGDHSFLKPLRLLTALLIISESAALAQGHPLPPGTSLLPANPLTAFNASGPPSTLQVRQVTADGFAAHYALQAKTLTKPQTPWLAQISARITAPVQRGDVILGKFHIRSEGGVSAQTAFVFEQAGPPYQQSVVMNLQVTPKWQTIYVPFRANMSFAPGGAQINFRLGFQTQTVEIADISVVDYGSKISLRALPVTPITYQGESLTASWRKAAQQRIEKYRMAPFTIRVINAEGKPVKNALVHIEMTRHAFAFGSAVDASRLLGNTPNDKQYQHIVKKYFNRVVLENDLKWPEWQQDPQMALNGMAWLHRNHIQIRGHNLVWPASVYLPQNIAALKNDPAALNKAINQHIVQELDATRGQCVEWDVANEVVHNQNIIKLLPPDIVAHWYKLAHQTDPSSRLFINDYSIVAAGGKDTESQNAYYSLIQSLLAQGAPVQGIGIQCHFDTDLTPPSLALKILNRFAALGLPLEVTEMDITVPSEQLQANYLRDFMTAAFSQPDVEGIIMWGFWQKAHWRPQAALWRTDWSLKPAGKEWLHLVFDKWWTDATLHTSAKGECSVKGYLGDYLVHVDSSSGAITQKAVLKQPGNTLTVQIP